MPDNSDSVNTKSTQPPLTSDEVLRRMLSMPHKQHNLKTSPKPQKKKKTPQAI